MENRQYTNGMPGAPTPGAPTPGAPAPGVPTPGAPMPAAPTPGAPMSAPPFAFQTGQHYKVHHSYVWLSSLVAVGAVLVVGILSNMESLVQAGLFMGESGISLLVVLGLGVLGIALLYGLIVGVSALSYKHLSYVFDEKEFSLYSGIITKRHVHVPYARVQSVNHKQTLVQRLAGVCTVEIDTAGGAANKAVKVPYVKLDVGEAIRFELFTRKALNMAQGSDQPVATTIPGAPMPAAGMQENILDEAAEGLGVDNFRGLYGGTFMGMEPVSFERKLNNKELLLASLSSSGVAGTAITLALLFVFGAVFLGIVLPEFRFAGLFMIPLFVVGFVFLVAASIGTTALSYGSFSVRRRGSRIEVERGILQRDFSGIDIDRVQSVVVRQSFIRRLLGYCEVSLGRVRAGSGEDQNTQAKLNTSGLVVHPFLKINQVDSLLAGLLPEFADRPASQEFCGLPAIALRRGIVRRCLWRNGLFWVVVGAIALQVFLNVLLVNYIGALSPDEVALINAMNAGFIALYLFFIGELVLIVLGTVWWKRGSGFAMNRRYVALCNDGLNTETIYLPRQKIQDVVVRTNPFQRAAHVATIGATTAAGVGGTHKVLWDVAEEDAAAWLDWLKPRTGNVMVDYVATPTT